MWFWWLLIVLFAVNALGEIALIDAKRRTVTKRDAIAVVLGDALLIWGIVHYGFMR